MSRIHEALKKAEQGQNVDFGAASTTRDEVFSRLQVSSLDEITSAVGADAARGDAGWAGDEAWLAKVQRCDWNPDVKRVLFSDPNRHYETGMEEFRTLRSRLYQIREKTPIKKIMIASALSGEGKTFVSANLAYTLVRQHGRRVLLIDADVRKPHLHESLGAPDAPGLNEYLAGKADEISILQTGSCDNLFIIPGGRPVDNPSELIGNGRLKLLLDRLAPLFHWVLFDSPPLVPIADGSIISGYADGIILVVKAQHTPVAAVQRARQELTNRPVLGVVLNRTPEKSGYSSYYYSYPSSDREKNPTR